MEATQEQTQKQTTQKSYTFYRIEPKSAFRQNILHPETTTVAEQEAVVVEPTNDVVAVTVTVEPTAATKQKKQTGKPLIDNDKIRRLVAITYTTENNTVKYGAAIFKKDKPDEVFNKKKLRQTALGRLEKHPQTIVFNNDELKTMTKENVADYIRNYMHTHGVKSKEKSVQV
jgi:hypothetical protein